MPETKREQMQIQTLFRAQALHFFKCSYLTVLLLVAVHAL